MDNSKRIEILTQNNKKLIRENDRLRKKIETYIQEGKKINVLRDELEIIRQTWITELDEIEKQKKEYSALLKEIREFKDELLYGKIVNDN